MILTTMQRQTWECRRRRLADMDTTKPVARVDSDDKVTAWVMLREGREAMFCFSLESEAEEFVEFINDNCEYASY